MLTNDMMTTKYLMWMLSWIILMFVKNHILQIFLIYYSVWTPFIGLLVKACNLNPWNYS